VLRRELAIVLRAPLTWAAATLAALLIGHGFVLAVDLYSAASRSALASTLSARELDPLAGLVRPTLGGLYLAVSLLAPIVAARPIAIEKERRGFHQLVLLCGSPARVVAAKALAALAGVAPLLLPPLALLGLWRALGGHLSVGETLVALSAHGLYALLVAALAIAAAAWTETLAQAVVVALVCVAASWAIDASEGFAALAWLGRAVDWSVTTHLHPMERGTLAVGASLWFAVFASGALSLAWLGARFDLPRPARAGGALALVVVTLFVGGLAHRVRTIVDATEQQRASLPPAAGRALRTLPSPLRLIVWLDRDDARRQQLEADVLAKLRIARPDLEVRTPLDDRAAPAEGEREEGYGRIAVEVGSAHRETYSASRKELVTLLLEAGGRPAPDWAQPEYPGHPLVIEGARRRLVLFVAYAGLPLLLALLGWLITRSPRRTS
jgi:hypothetical protein